MVFFLTLNGNVFPFEVYLEAKRIMIICFN